MPEDVPEDREICGIRKLGGEARDNQNGFLPPGMKSELRSQLPSILAHYVERTDTAAFL